MLLTLTAASLPTGKQKSTAMAKTEDKKKYASKFEEVYNEGAAATKSEDQPLVERQLRRQWESAHDSAEGKIMRNKKAINAELAQLGECDINKVIVLEKDNIDLALSMEVIEEQYGAFFGDTYPGGAVIAD